MSHDYCQKTANNKFGQRWGEQGTIVHFWWDCKPVQPHWKTVRTFLEKLKIQFPYDSAIPLLDIYMEKATVQKDMCIYMHHYVHSSTIHSSQDMDTT